MVKMYINKNMFETTSLFTKGLSSRKVNEVVGQVYAVCSMAELVNRQSGIR